MRVKVVLQPDRAISQSVLYFQMRFMGWSVAEMDEQADRYGSLPFGYVVGYERDEIVAAVNLLEREIEYEGTKIRLGGIGGVCVHRDYRRQSRASQLLRVSLDQLKQRGVDLVFLCTSEATEGVYEKMGFTKLGRKYVAWGESGKRYEGEGGMIAPIGANKVVAKVRRGKQPFDLQGQDW